MQLVAPGRLACGPCSVLACVHQVAALPDAKLGVHVDASHSRLYLSQHISMPTAFSHCNPMHASEAGSLERLAAEHRQVVRPAARGLAQPGASGAAICLPVDQLLPRRPPLSAQTHELSLVLADWTGRWRPLPLLKLRAANSAAVHGHPLNCIAFFEGYGGKVGFRTVEARPTAFVSPARFPADVSTARPARRRGTDGSCQPPANKSHWKHRIYDSSHREAPWTVTGRALAAGREQAQSLAAPPAASSRQQAVAACMQMAALARSLSGPNSGNKNLHSQTSHPCEYTKPKIITTSARVDTQMRNATLEEEVQPPSVAHWLEQLWEEGGAARPLAGQASWVGIAWPCWCMSVRTCMKGR